MKRILLFIYAVALLFFPASLRAQGAPIKPVQLQTKPAIPLQPIKGLEGLGDKIRSQQEQEAVNVQECLNFYVWIKSAYDNVGSSGERVLSHDQIVCRLLSREQEALLFPRTGTNVFDMLRKCWVSSDDIGSCPLPLSSGESSPFLDSGPFDSLGERDDEGRRKRYLCVNPTKLNEAIEGCTQELSRHPIRVEIPRP